MYGEVNKTYLQIMRACVTVGSRDLRFVQYETNLQDGICKGTNVFLQLMQLMQLISSIAFSVCICRFDQGMELLKRGVL